MDRWKVGLIVLIVTGASTVSFTIGTRLYSGVDGGGFSADAYADYPMHVTSSRAEIFFALRVEVGPPLDVFFFAGEDFQRYLSGLSPLDAGSVMFLDIFATSNSFFLSAGDYHLVFDNTGYGVARPNGQDTFVTYSIQVDQQPSLIPHRLYLPQIAAFVFALAVVVVTVCAVTVILWDIHGRTRIGQPTRRVSNLSGGERR